MKTLTNFFTPIETELASMAGIPYQKVQVIATHRLSPGGSPVEEPPNEPKKPPVEEPGQRPDKPPIPNKPPVEEPWRTPPRPPVKEPPPEDPNHR